MQINQVTGDFNLVSYFTSITWNILECWTNAVTVAFEQVNMYWIKFMRFQNCVVSSSLSRIRHLSKIKSFFWIKCSNIDSSDEIVKKIMSGKPKYCMPKYCFYSLSTAELNNIKSEVDVFAQEFFNNCLEKCLSKKVSKQF